VIPLAASIQGSHELTQVTLTKVMGRADALPKTARLRGLLNDVKAAFCSVIPHPEAEITSARSSGFGRGGPGSRQPGGRGGREGGGAFGPGD
jgi:hypothetical protein